MLAISDLHVDYPDNQAWVEALPEHEHREDVLIVAGDVTDRLSLLARTLEALRRRFARVAYVPGNHEMWLRKGESGDSIGKFEAILALCRQLQVDVEPFQVGGPGSTWIVPLFSWYARPQDGSESLFVPKPGENPSLDVWADTHLCRWPRDAGFVGAAHHFSELNESRLARTYDGPVITFSHFLPRAELIFATRAERAAMGRVPVDPVPSFNFSRVAGSWRIDAQLRQLGARIHVYGHQHRDRWRLVDGVLYVSRCLGYPHREQLWRGRATLAVLPDPAHAGLAEARAE